MEPQVLGIGAVTKRCIQLRFRRAMCQPASARTGQRALMLIDVICGGARPHHRHV